jgi:hypothetical protein
MALHRNIFPEAQPYSIPRSRSAPPVRRFSSRVPLEDTRCSMRDVKNLFRAVGRGHTGEMQALLGKEEIDPNIIGKWGDSLLMVASAKGHSRMVKLLIDKGADPNIQGKYGFTPLMLAVKWGYDKETIDTLLESGARVRTRNALFGTVMGDLHWAKWIPQETMEKLEQKWNEESPLHKIKEFFSGKLFHKKIEA